MNYKEILNYLISFFDINPNPYILNDLIEEIDNIDNAENLIPFVKKKIGYEKYRYISGGLQKLTALIEDFKKDNHPKLSDEMRTKALTYSDTLFKKATYILDELHFELQNKGKKIDDVNLNDTFLRNGLEKHHISILNAIGDKKKLMHLCMYGKEQLRLQIDSIVNKKALVKEYPQLANNKSEDVKVLEMIKKGVKK